MPEKPFGHEGTIGVPEPTPGICRPSSPRHCCRSSGGGNAMPGIQELNLTLQARWEEYTVEGADGCEDAPAQNTSYFRCELGKARLIKAKFDKLSPTFGFRWRPVNEISFRARLTRNFRAPTFHDLFSPDTQSLCDSFGTYDPLDGSFVPGACELLGANPNLPVREFPPTCRWASPIVPSGPRAGKSKSITPSSTSRIA